ncbi:MAG TPA: hypothetical protein PK228_00095 [Saprospiraceae bacterium]|nr:hypothetical protein [Saprospiraceae bacterium]
MRYLFICCLLLLCSSLPAQVFMRSFDNAASLSLGGAGVAYPGMATGLSNEALTGFGEKIGVLLGSAIPYSISGWQTAQFQGFTKIGDNDGLGIDITHSGIEVYQEQQFRMLYGRRMGERFYFGGSAAFMRVSAQEYGSANGITFGLGLLANVLPGVWLGARVHNPFQQKVGDYTAAGSMRIGAAWQTSNILTVLAEVEKSLDRSAQIKAGIEYRPVEVLVIRTGVRTGGAARIGFGAGVRLKNGLAFDVGSEWHPSLGITPAAMFLWRK